MSRWPLDKKLQIGLLAVLLVVGAVVGLRYLASGQSTSGATTTPAAATSPVRGVWYEVEGTATAANIIVQTPTGTMRQLVAVPLRNPDGSSGLRYTDFPSGAQLAITVQNDATFGTVTCRIKDLASGTVLAEDTNAGDFAKVSCSARAR